MSKVSATCPECGVRLDCEKYVVEEPFDRRYRYPEHQTAGGDRCLGSGTDVYDDGELLHWDESDPAPADVVPFEDGLAPARVPVAEQDYTITPVTMPDSDSALLVVINAGPNVDQLGKEALSHMLTTLIADFGTKWPERFIRGALLPSGASVTMLTDADLASMGLIRMEAAPSACADWLDAEDPPGLRGKVQRVAKARTAAHLRTYEMGATEDV